MRLAPLAKIALSGVALISLAGCVPQNQYDDLMTAYRAKEQQLLQMQNEWDTSRANEDMLRKQLGEAMARLAQMKTGGNEAEIAKMQAMIDGLIKQIGTTALPADVTSALQTLASEHSELLSFDPETGLVRFKSDVTFDSGSAKLKSEASSVLAQFAAILNKASAQDLEIRVVGHTDNVRISKPETLKLHPTNTHLSAHRAISVRDELVKDQVAKNRFMVAGYGEFRPIAENAKNGNAQNRRVEVYLVAMPKNALHEADAAQTAPTVATPVETKSTNSSDENTK